LDSSGANPDRAFAHQLMEMLAIPVFVLDTSSRVIIWNRACERLTGVMAAEVIGSRDHWRSFFEEQRPTLADLLMQERIGDTCEVHHLHPRQGQPNHLSAEGWCDMPRMGRRRYLASDASPIFDERGKLSAVVQTLRDMTDEKLAQIALEQLATRDGLTGLANRRCFDETLHAEWARALRQRQPLSLLMVDVDNFKAYNDAHGHLGGDECLKRIATAVASEMRANDLVARYGGEEFSVVLAETDSDGARQIAEQIRQQVEQLPLVGADGAPMTASIGIATWTADSELSLEQLLFSADKALYQAKEGGRNRVVCASV
jgi:diguanylate cyclase (GGDEF)-like protein/PAS domain S-box-containing protein